jgi:hypothetical protein
MAQPSVAVRRKHCIIASVVVWPSTSPSIQPSGVAMCGLPASASARVISRSGLVPGCTRRKSLRMYSSPKTIEVLLCSAPMTRLGRVVSSSPVAVKLMPCSVLPAAMRSSRPVVAAVSWTAS